MSKNQSTDPTFESVWETLSNINVNEKTEKKNGLTYLSWSWAWETLMKEYPYANYEFRETEWCEHTNTATVWCTLYIGSLQRTMWLPVMGGYANKAVVKPTSKDIANTRMRCLTKCMAMFGLGHYIYAGEDLPANEKVTNETENEATPDKSKPKLESVPKSAPTKHTAKKEPDTSGQLNAETASGTVDFMIKMVDEMHSSSMEDLTSFWGQNKQTIDQLDSNFKPEYDRLKAHFTATKQKLIGEN